MKEREWWEERECWEGEGVVGGGKECENRRGWEECVV